MERVSPPLPLHLVPPLPQRISSTRSHRSGVTHVTPPSPLTPTRNGNVHLSPVFTSGRLKPSLTGNASNSAHRLSNLYRVSPNHRRAVNNDYRDLSAPGGENRHYPPSRDVIVELSEGGGPVSRATSVEPIIIVDHLSKCDSETVDRFSKCTDDDRSAPSSPPCVESIMCADCGKCRCAECARRATTSSPVCCVDSSTSDCAGCDRVVDAVTCMCCVRTIFASDSSDNPCICPSSPAACCRRWTALVAMSACLPCLCLYLPLRCLVCACSELRTSSRRACRCVPHAAFPLAVDSWQTSPKQQQQQQMMMMSSVAKSAVVSSSPRVERKWNRSVVTCTSHVTKN